MTVPQLRLFGPAADAAGVRQDTVPGANVNDVLAAAAARYGPEFARLAPRCRVWVNGQAPEPGVPLTAADEVALLPPVSGGCAGVR